MDSREEKNRCVVKKLGYWSSLICAGCFVIYVICFFLIFLFNPLFTWSDLPHFIDYVNKYNQIYKYMAMSSMLLFGLSYMVLLNAIRESIVGEQRILADISLSFGLIFALLISINYFLQITTVRLYIDQGLSTGLEQLIQSNPLSASASINMLGWTVFLGLSSLFMAPLFSSSKVSLERWIGFSFLANGVNAVLALVGFLLQHFLLTFLTMFLGLGVTVFCITITLWIFFLRIDTDK